MKLMRKTGIRILTVLLYLWTAVALPVCLTPATPAPSHTCTCPMCKTMGGSQHCTCCTGEHCTCRMSSDADNVRWNLVLDPAVLRGLEDFLVVFPSAGCIPGGPQSTWTPALNTPTPPPKA